jgi:hypothetical protein
VVRRANYSRYFFLSFLVIGGICCKLLTAAKPLQGYNPMHLACYGGHVTVVGLLLSRSAELLQSHDKHGKTGLHIAATHGHYQMVEVLLGECEK